MHTSSELISGLIAGMNERRARAQAIAESSKADMLVHDVDSDWTAKDLITHLTMFEEDALECLDSFMRGDKYRLDFRGATSLNDFNGIRRQERIHLTWEEALQQWHDAREQLKAAILRFPEDQLEAEFSTPFLQKLTLINTAKSCGVHEKEHIGQIHAALETQNKS